MCFEVSYEGETFHQVAAFERYNADSEGLRFTPLDPAKPVKAVRVRNVDVGYMAVYSPESSGR